MASNFPNERLRLRAWRQRRKESSTLSTTTCFDESSEIENNDEDQLNVGIASDHGEMNVSRMSISEDNDNYSDNNSAPSTASISPVPDPDLSIDLIDPEDEVDVGLRNKLKDWAIKHGCTRSCVDDVLGIFIEYGFDLPKDSRTLRSTPRTVNARDLGDGSYVYIGVKKCIEKLTSFKNVSDEVIKLFINIDGLPIFKSNSFQVWPILIQFSDFLPIGVAFYGGKKKPVMDEFCKEFVSEMQQIIQEGVIIEGEAKKVEIYCLPCDAPARAMLKGTVQHTGFYSCDRCDVKGTYVKNRVVFFKEDKIVKRDGTSFKMMAYEKADENGKRHQLKESPIAGLPIDFVNDFPLDYMHVVCLGVTRRLLSHLKGSFKGINDGRLSSPFLKQISQQLTDLNGTFPSEFARQPRSLEEIDRWKATELRSFLLYSGPVVLRGFLSPTAWKHFMSFSIAIRILCIDDLEFRNKYLDISRQLLEYFVYNSHEHYGKTFCVYNVHLLLHVPDDVQYFQAPLDTISAFQFENHLQKIKQMVRGKVNPISQIVKNSMELGGEYYVNTPQPKKISSKPKDACFLTKSGLVVVKDVNIQGRYVCERYSKNLLESFFNVFEIDSCDLGIYVLRRESKFSSTVCDEDDFLLKCVTIPYKEDIVVLSMLQ